MMRDAKSRRIAAVACIGGISALTLVQIVASIKREPVLLDDISNRWVVDDAVNSIMDRLGCQEKLVMVNGTQLTWEVASLRHCLHYFAEDSANFRIRCSKIVPI